MFGYFRFFLASLVLLSHLGIGLLGFNPGIAAVVSFYILAGFVVCNLFSNKFVAGKPLYLQFYYERSLRIFPQYFFIAALTLVFILTTKYGTPRFDLVASINNILIIPLNYNMVIDNSILQEPKWWLIPPAWSLGVELQAYLILPFIIYFKPIKFMLAITSLCIFILASIGVMHTEYFGYRLLPGVLFIFILGTSIYKNTSGNGEPDMFDKYFPTFVYTVLVFLLIILGMHNLLLSPIRETIFGILIGLPVITYLASSKIKAPINRFLGDLSYGLFLSHFLAIWVIDYYSLIDKFIAPFLYVATVFIISLIVSFVGILAVENNIRNYRFSISKSVSK